MRSLFLIGEAEKDRVEAFSDGVLAIVITLLVLELKVPEHVTGGDPELWRALAERVPAILAWVVSFVYVLVFWVAHHYLFEQLANVDRGLLWLNGLFLLAISFTPFPTSLAGEVSGRDAGRLHAQPRDVQAGVNPKHRSRHRLRYGAGQDLAGRHRLKRLQRGVHRVPGEAPDAVGHHGRIEPARIVKARGMDRDQVAAWRRTSGRPGCRRSGRRNGSARSRYPPRRASPPPCR